MKRVLAVLATFAVVAASLGCDRTAESTALPPDDLQPREELAEVDVGTFRIPLAAVDQRQREGEGLAERNALLLRFHLFALVPQHQEDHVTTRIQSHGARLREDVIRTCRKATLDELEEPALITLKMELHKVLGRYFGPKHLRQIVITNVLLEPT